MYNTNYPNKVGWCRFCNQGWLEILKEIATGRLSIVCSECDAEYDTPEDMISGRYSSPYKGGRRADPDIEEIKAIGWDSYILRDCTKYNQY